jgi:integration host factor subunit alpha
MPSRLRWPNAAEPFRGYEHHGAQGADESGEREAKEIVEAFFEEIRVALESSEQVKLSGFGNFDLRDKRQRPGRNPKTGVEIPISARRVVTFRPGQKLKQRVETYAGSEQ